MYRNFRHLSCPGSGSGCRRIACALSQAVVAVGGSMLLLGGIGDGGARLEDAWRSADGGSSWVPGEGRELDLSSAQGMSHSKLFQDPSIIGQGEDMQHCSRDFTVQRSCEGPVGSDLGNMHPSQVPLVHPDHCRRLAAAVVWSGGRVLLLGGLKSSGTPVLAALTVSRSSEGWGTKVVFSS